MVCIFSAIISKISPGLGWLCQIKDNWFILSEVRSKFQEPSSTIVIADQIWITSSDLQGCRKDFGIVSSSGYRKFDLDIEEYFKTSLALRMKKIGDADRPRQTDGWVCCGH